MSTPGLLQPLAFPLYGSRLIDASAGTGKTFTIAALYLRLVLGHGGPAGYARALTPPEILVVTFTEAATKELRDRIRARLAEAAEAFLADPAEVAAEPEGGADLLHELRADYPPAQWPACARALRLAAEWMDEAAVSTIHGWCNRMLREHAFDSGSLFTQALEADQRELRAEAVRDYWRSFIVPLPLEDAAQIYGWWKTPDALAADVERLLGLAAELDDAAPPAVSLKHHREDTARQLGLIKAPWAAGWIDELQALLDQAVAGKRVDGRKLQARYYQPWFDQLRSWVVGDHVQPMAKDNKGWTRLTPGGLAEAFKGPPPEHPALHDMSSLPDRLNALRDGRDAVLRHAARWCAGRLAGEQERRAQMGFDELLTRLDAALQGPNGSRLAALIRRQFPVALIDEFQDTDPLQYRIFDAIYRIAADARDQAVILIGDPKQAIYAFRGADIHTYLAARRDTEGRHATLGTNFRSTAAMVQAVNRVFMQAERRPDGAGAFLFRHAGQNPMPFIEVQAKGRAERWMVQGEAAPALTCWTLAGDDVVASGDAQRMLAEACATEIVRLLQQGQAGVTGFERAQQMRPLRPGDIAVLVNNGRQADAVRQSLQLRAVRSVYLSDQQAVFQNPVVDDLQRWLRACAEPDEDRWLRAALGTPTLALSWAALDRLNQDELLWEGRVLQFRRYQQTWRRQGVLPMLRHLLNDFGVPERLLASGDERSLTDLLHLAELLQQASAQLDGEHALIRWLAEQKLDMSGENEARRLRLESDADLVKVVTIHKSKGLEYPLVFLPFATAFRPTRPDDLPLKWHDENGRLQVSLEPDDQALAAVEQERLGEDLRKLYVALTRARHATWIGVAPLAEVERSALGYLLGGGTELPPPALRDSLDALAQGCPAIEVRPAPQPDDACFVPAALAAEPAPEPPLPGGPRERWWIASYSALSRTADRLDEDAALALGDAALRLMLPATPASAAEEIYADSRLQSESQSQPQSQPQPQPQPALAAGGDAPSSGSGLIGLADPAISGSLHDFPRGAAAGSFLHGLLEWAGRRGFDRLHAEPEAQAELAELIARRCKVNGWDAWVGPLAAWLREWLAASLDLSGLGGGRVAPAAMGRVQIEMEFWFEVRQVDLQALDALVRRHTLDGARRPPLGVQQINGMLKGYIDLVFEHQGRYYVADYKSNWLGPRDADYAPAALRASVLEHRYELQYLLYVFALHRLLRSRLADYDYERHMGGAVYLFLRGHAAAGQGLHCERPPRELIEALDRLFDGAALESTP